MPSPSSTRLLTDTKSYAGLQLSAVVVASAKQIVITVGDPLSSDNATTVFRPAEVKANIGDVVLFNCESSSPTEMSRGHHLAELDTRDPRLSRHATRFPATTIESSVVIERDTVIPVTQGNHSATQSTFASPCIPAHDTNVTINGFNSDLRPTNNGTAITNLPVTITTNDTIWFYDIATCAEGGVGGININDSSTETLEGFERNAIRLNGTSTSSSSAASATSTSPSGTSSGSTASRTPTNGSTNAAERVVVRALAAAVPMALVAMLL
ncbi:hypothetical protein ACG7TL_008671 [Trametes sanguinea]